MDDMVKQRLVGASVLALAGAIVLPLLFGQPQDPRGSIRASFEGEPVSTRPPQRQTPEASERALQDAGPAATRAPQQQVRSVTPKPAALPTPAASASPRWILQLASYSDQASADDFRARLRKQGLSAYRESITVKGKTYFRVRMVLDMNESEAQALKRRLESAYKLQAQLLPAR